MLPRVLVLSNRGNMIKDAIEASNCDFAVVSADYPVEMWPDSDWVVSFGYRKLIPEYLIEKYRGQIINIHMSLLPLNRGAHPNFWSWFDNTLRGVTIHRVHPLLDAGEILAQQKLDHGLMSDFRQPATLTTTYNDLLVAATGLFDRSWKDILRGQAVLPKPLAIKPSYHRASDIDRFFNMLSCGWDAPVREVSQLGQLYRGESI